MFWLPQTDFTECFKFKSKNEILPLPILVVKFWLLFCFCFFHFSLRSGGQGQARETTGPVQVAGACASFYPKKPGKGPRMTFKTARLVSFKMFVSVMMFFSPDICRLRRILNAIAFKLFTLGVLAAVFIYCVKILKRLATTAQGTILHGV